MTTMRSNWILCRLPFGLAVLAVLIVGSSALSQCSGGSCIINQPIFNQPMLAVSQTTNTSYVWKYLASSKQYALLRDGKQVGNWNAGVYYPFDGTSWGEACEPPIQPPVFVEKKDKRTAKGDDCTTGCPCQKCGEECQCRSSGKPCGGDCLCVAGKAQGKATGQVIAQVGTVKGKEPLCGVDFSKFTPRPRRYLYHDGQKTHEVTRAEALRRAEQMVEADIPDDSTKFRIVVAGGTDSERKGVLSDLGKLSEAVKAKVIVNAVPADSPLVKTRKVVADGHPSVTVMAPDGVVIGRNKDGLWDQKKVPIIEQKIQEYDPSKDPDLVPPAPKPDPKLPNPTPDPNNPKPAPLMPDLQAVPWWVWVLGAGALIFLLKKKE